MFDKVVRMQSKGAPAWPRTVLICKVDALPYAILPLDLVSCDFMKYMTMIFSERDYAFTKCCDFTEYNINMAIDGGYPIITTGKWDLVKDVKEMLSYIDSNFDMETKAATESSDREKNYELTDGNIVTTGCVRFCCRDVLLQTSVVDKEDSCIHDAIFQPVMKCDVDIYKNLYGNMVRSEGKVILAGIGEWVMKEFMALVPFMMKIKVGALLEYLVGLGGLVFLWPSAFQQTWTPRRSMATLASPEGKQLVDDR